MDKSDGFVKNYNLINCYVDTSYYNYSQNTIYTSKFSNEEEQTELIEYDFVVVANPGFKLKQEFSFKLLPQLDQIDWTFDDTIEWLEITQESFKPLTTELDLDINPKRYDFQLAGIDLNNSLVFETEINGTPIYLFLLGGFNEQKLVFRFYEKWKYNSSNKYGDIPLYELVFYHNINRTINKVGCIPLLNDLMFTAEGGENLDIDINNSFFTTYYVDIDTLREIKHNATLNEELIINTYSYPIKFNDEELIESSIKKGYISTEINAKIFKKNYTSLDIFKFTVPDISDVTECFVKIPFNNDISLDYEDIKGKTIRGYITYEVLTNTTTLFITDEEKILYKNTISLGVEIPYKPSAELKNYKDIESRLAYEEPKLYIKGVGKSIKGNYLRGFMKAPKNILKDELDLLNNLLNEGVFINDENN